MNSKTEVNDEASKLNDDFSLSRVPDSKRDPMWKILLIRIGNLTCVSQFMLGAELGYGLTFSQAFWATMIGSVVLQFISYGLGVAGQREGLSTSLLSKWAGFGIYGSALVGLAFAISLTGWFGIQNSVFAQGIVSILGNHANLAVTSAITGIAVTLVVLFGFKSMSWTANIAVPGFLLIMGIGSYNMLQSHSLVKLVTMAPPSNSLTFSAAVTMVTGGFIVGCIITPDITRFAKSSHDVFWATLIGTMLGELGVNLLAVLMAHAIGTSEIMPIIYKLTGIFGILIVVFSTLKVNDINLYSSSLGFVNFLKQVFNINVNRAVMTVIIGVLGTILSLMGIMQQFESFLSFLGIIFPPIAGIMFVDYFLLKRSRHLLDESRRLGKLPESAEKLNPVTLIAWIIGSAAGFYIKVGIQSITSIIVAAVIYYIGIKIFYKEKK
ncbi:permease for cytosine purines uracil thiamine allantoin [Liquorilactobacillus ghanensis DSM 18630]|uniref:Permease for cytosine purines uracil thiamine allantoin n=1 Tax=Liquorilactobacillus ghanensis DSM 18630 TaxID=1423750 RepID=A0A0R1VLY9_9LACO|nr:cytosine permease [Liquorilactobacillus ghanensis]KRM03977.1 permease for cytosine purines uracil thiamine allantoin [Liquorilactobacillus ghanensis DSM 18630]